MIGDPRHARQSAHLLLSPRAIAVAGASNNPMKMGTLQGLSILQEVMVR